MGDASWLNDIGLSWGWDKNYPDFHEQSTVQEQWKSRSSKNRQHIYSKEAIELAKDLVNIKNELQALKEKEKNLKDQLKTHMPNLSWLEVTTDQEHYIIENLTIRKRPALITKKALHFIKNKYGEKAAITLAEECTTKNKPFSSIFIRSFPKENNKK